MELWGLILLAINVLLLLAGWLMFQQAKSDLTARAAQIPVLSEVKALEDSVRALLEQLKADALQTSAQLDDRIAASRSAIQMLEMKLEDAERRSSVILAPSPVPQPSSTEPVRAVVSTAVDGAEPQESKRPSRSRARTEKVPVSAVSGNAKYDTIYKLSDEGKTISEIATQVGGSVSEVELVLTLRAKNA